MTEAKHVLKSCLNGHCEFFGPPGPCLNDDCDWLPIIELMDLSRKISRKIPREELKVSVILPNNLECNCMVELNNIYKNKKGFRSPKNPSFITNSYQLKLRYMLIKCDMCQGIVPSKKMVGFKSCCVKSGFKCECQYSMLCDDCHAAV